MAPEMSSQTCTNCAYRHTSGQFPHCVECNKNGKPGNQFPGWKAELD